MFSRRSDQYGCLALVMVLLCAAMAAAQGSNANASRTVKAGGGPGQPALTFRVSASGAQGRIEVRGATGLLLQALGCPLLRDEAQPTAAELAAAREQFAAGFAAEDLNFDGYADLKAPREFGAKWARYCVWIFDPSGNQFVKDELAEQMELLYNLTADARRHLIVAYSIGPAKPMRDEYRIEPAGANRPYWPRLIPVESCFADGPAGDAGTVVVTRYDQGRAAISRLPSGSRGCDGVE